LSEEEPAFVFKLQGTIQQSKVKDLFDWICEQVGEDEAAQRINMTRNDLKVTLEYAFDDEGSATMRVKQDEAGELTVECTGNVGDDSPLPPSRLLKAGTYTDNSGDCYIVCEGIEYAPHDIIKMIEQIKKPTELPQTVQSQTER